jgi:hypothetical protein
METRIQSSGKLRSRHLPALYLDPSFFVRYVAAVVTARSAETGLAPPLPRVTREEAAGYAEIVRRARDGTLGLTPVVSSLTLLRWMQDAVPLYAAEDRDAHHGIHDFDFEGLRYQGWLHAQLGDALDGVLQVDLQGFALAVDAVWDELPAIALLDGAERCALDALAARHLGCTHLATALPEMVRVCELLRSTGGPQPLLGPAAVVAATTAPPVAGPAGD